MQRNAEGRRPRTAAKPEARVARPKAKAQAKAKPRVAAAKPKAKAQAKAQAKPRVAAAKPKAKAKAAKPAGGAGRPATCQMEFRMRGWRGCPFTAAAAEMLGDTRSSIVYMPWGRKYRGWNTVPVIWRGRRFIGGASELKAELEARPARTAGHGFVPMVSDEPAPLRVGRQ